MKPQMKEKTFCNFLVVKVNYHYIIYLAIYIIDGYHDNYTQK